MVTTVISPDQLQVPAGAVLRIPATWQEYQTIAAQRGSRSIPRLKYQMGELWLMSPLPVHGRDAHLLSQIVITLLDHQQRDNDAFTSITMDLPEESGIEPDYCFYIDNWEAVSGKDRINWQLDPPPDLVIEVNVTSYTDIADYLPYRVPEVWIWKRKVLTVYQLQDNKYSAQSCSGLFPGLELQGLIDQCFRDTSDRNTSFAIRNLRQGLGDGAILLSQHFVTGGS
jgi:Uma2 family endonuclease